MGHNHASPETKVKDPVCGMDVDTTTAKHQTEYDGQTFYFCCAGCKSKFEKSPESYLPKSGPAEECERSRLRHDR